MPIAWKNSRTSTGVGAAPTLTASNWSKPSCARSGANIGSSAARPRLLELVGHRLAGLLQAHPVAATPRSARCVPSRCSSGSAGDHRLQAGLELLPDARHGEEPRRPHLGEQGDDLARVRAGGDRQAVGDRQVVVGDALGDVGGGQPRDHAAVLGQADHLVDVRTALITLRWTQLHALGRPVVPDV